MTIWVDRWIIFIDEEHIDSANAQYSPIDPDTGGDRTFDTVRLSPTGEEKRTHAGCNTAATEQMTQGIFQAFQHAPWANIYDAHEWTWEDALNDMGLQVIEAEIESQTLTARATSAVKSDAAEFWTGVKGLPAEVWKRITKPPQEW